MSFRLLASRGTLAGAAWSHWIDAPRPARIDPSNLRNRLTVLLFDIDAQQPGIDEQLILVLRLGIPPHIGDVRA